MHLPVHCPDRRLGRQRGKRAGLALTWGQRCSSMGPRRAGAGAATVAKCHQERGPSEGGGGPACSKERERCSERGGQEPLAAGRVKPVYLLQKGSIACLTRMCPALRPALQSCVCLWWSRRTFLPCSLHSSQGTLWGSSGGWPELRLGGCPAPVASDQCDPAVWPGPPWTACLMWGRGSVPLTHCICQQVCPHQGPERKYTHAG